MSDDEWEDLDELAHLTVMLHLGESIVLDACTSRDVLQSF